jgi:peptide/nickel transport system ATP-binding protein
MSAPAYTSRSDVLVRPPVDIEISGLTVSYRRSHDVAAVAELDLQLRAGESVAIVGESGSGKSTTVGALLGLLPYGTRVEAERFEIGGVDLRRGRRADFRGIRGRLIGFVPQDPMVGLNPTQRIGRQIAESLTVHHAVARQHVRDRVESILTQLGFPDPVRVMGQYPHELSGGMRQRVLIAIALAPDPPVIIADEPTSALDVTVQKAILDDLLAAVRQRDAALLIVTHDLGVAADRADRIVVMKAGRVVESGAAAVLLSRPQHPYTRSLIEAAPSLAVLDVLERRARTSGARSSDPVLELTGVSKAFPVRGANGSRHLHQVLDQVSFEVHRGSTLALVGESGSGKTTTARIIAGFIQPDEGSVRFDGANIGHQSRSEWRAFRRRLQFVYQNPYSSLDPSSTIGQILVEPLRNFGIGSRSERTAAAGDVLEQVGLPRSYLKRRPSQLSGGQRQRVAIARALALRPDVVVLDEPVSALDVSVQHQILELLRELQAELGLTYVIVSHDLAVVAELANDVAVLADGSIVDYGPARRVFTQPAHPVTESLIASIPGQHSLTKLPER